MTAPADGRILAEYFNPLRVIVAKRNSVALINWAQEIATEEIPDTVDDDWVKQCLLASRIMPQAGPDQQYVLITRSYFLADADTQANIRQLCSDMNTEAEEVSLANQVATVLRRFIQQFADTQITPDQIASWYLDNDVAPPTNSAVLERVIKLREMKQAGAQTYVGV